MDPLPPVVAMMVALHAQKSYINPPEPKPETRRPKRRINLFSGLRTARGRAVLRPKVS